MPTILFLWKESERYLDKDSLVFFLIIRRLLALWQLLPSLETQKIEHFWRLDSIQSGSLMHRTKSSTHFIFPRALLQTLQPPYRRPRIKSISFRGLTQHWHFATHFHSCWLPAASTHFNWICDLWNLGCNLNWQAKHSTYHKIIGKVLWTLSAWHCPELKKRITDMLCKGFLLQIC